jgi:hypothetical protein
LPFRNRGRILGHCQWGQRGSGNLVDPPRQPLDHWDDLPEDLEQRRRFRGLTCDQFGNILYARILSGHQFGIGRSVLARRI